LGFRILRQKPIVAHGGGEHCGLRLLIVIAGALALGACSKCDVPFWRHDAPPAPASCHDAPEAK
jgi:hypothetical protein